MKLMNININVILCRSCWNPAGAASGSYEQAKQAESRLATTRFLVADDGLSKQYVVALVCDAP